MTTCCKSSVVKDLLSAL